MKKKSGFIFFKLVSQSLQYHLLANLSLPHWMKMPSLLCHNFYMLIICFWTSYAAHQSVCLHDPVSHYFNVYLLIDRESPLLITHFLVISECLLFQLNLRIMLEIPSKIPLRTFWKWMKSEPETDTALGLCFLSPHSPFPPLISSLSVGFPLPFLL